MHTEYGIRRDFDSCNFSVLAGCCHKKQTKVPVPVLPVQQNTKHRINTMLVHSVEEEVVDTSAVVAKATVPSLDTDHPQPLKSNDTDIIALAHERYRNNKILEAYRLLQNVKDKSLLAGAKEQEICNVATECQIAIADLIEEPDHTTPGSIWKKQGESHGEYDTTIFYKVENKHLTCRLVTPIQSNLLIPLLSVLNESDLYSDWIPSWTIPFTIGIRTSNQYTKIGALDQIVHLIANVPWPFLPREVYIQSMVIDEIDEHNYFAVRLFTVNESDDGDSSNIIIDGNGSRVSIPTPLPTVQRFDFNGVLLFRPIIDNETNSQTMEVSFKM
jgi:hypothetical protein